MSEAVEGVKKHLITAMSEVEFIVTTTDCWTARRQSYIVYTAHWIEPTSPERPSAALACRHLKGSHIFDVLACADDEINSFYNIRDSQDHH